MILESGSVLRRILPAQKSLLILTLTISILPALHVFGCVGTVLKTSPILVHLILTTS